MRFEILRPLTLLCVHTLLKVRQGDLQRMQFGKYNYTGSLTIITDVILTDLIYEFEKKKLLS
jgi:hypothetical protein